MKTAYILLILLCIALILAVGATFIYLAFYRSYLSKRIENGIREKTDTKRLIEPPKFFVIAFLAFSIISSMVVSVSGHNENASYGELKKCGKDSLTAAFSHDDDIPGYIRYEKQKGDIRCVYYISDDKDSAFPALLLYIDCDSGYSFDYRPGGKNDPSSPVKSITSDNAEWYALKGSPEGGSLVISFSGGSGDDTLDIDF